MFRFDGVTYFFFESAMQAVMEAHPELGSDALSEYATAHIESGTRCPECGKITFTDAWGGACSANCWRYLYGEVD